MWTSILHFNNVAKIVLLHILIRFFCVYFKYIIVHVNILSVSMSVKNEPEWGGQCRGHPFCPLPSPRRASISLPLSLFPSFYLFFSPSPLFSLPGTGPQVSTAAPEPAHTPPGPQVLQDTGCGNNVTGVLPPCLQKIRFCGLFIWGEGGLSQTSCFKKLAWVL